MPQGWPCWTISNHDVARVMTRWGGAAASPRMSSMLSAMVCSLRGSVCIYQGEELGLPEAGLPFEALRDPYGIAFWPNFKGRGRLPHTHALARYAGRRLHDRYAVATCTAGASAACGLPPGVRPGVTAQRFPPLPALAQASARPLPGRHPLHRAAGAATWVQSHARFPIHSGGLQSLGPPADGCLGGALDLRRCGRGERPVGSPPSPCGRGAERRSKLQIASARCAGSRTSPSATVTAAAGRIREKAGTTTDRLDRMRLCSNPTNTIRRDG
jgi:hypothetical protein